MQRLQPAIRARKCHRYATKTIAARHPRFTWEAGVPFFPLNHTKVLIDTIVQLLRVYDSGLIAGVDGPERNSGRSLSEEYPK
jgi:hypothetical protein